MSAEDMRMSSPHIKQEPGHDSSPHVDSFHSMSEALQTVSNWFFHTHFIYSDLVSASIGSEIYRNYLI